MRFNLDDLTFEPNPAPFVPVTDDFDNVQSDEFYEPTPDEEAEISTAFGNAFAHEEETTYDDDEEMTDYNSDEPWDGFNSDAEADADVLRGIGWGTDEEYGGDSIDSYEW
jgi:hypothetical protein